MYFTLALMKNDWWGIPKIAFASRSPVSWFWGAAWLLFYPFLAVLIGILGTIFGLVQLAGFWHLLRVGNDARLTEAGVEVFSKRVGHIAYYPWSEVSQLRRVFEPPLMYWELVLTSGVAVPLPVAELDVEAFRTRGIAVDDHAKFRHGCRPDG